MENRGTIHVVQPGAEGPPGGNATTAHRWSRLLQDLGWNVVISESWDGSDCDLLVALHARKSHDSVVRFHRRQPGKPIVVAGTGTDLYSDVPDGGEVRESLGLATRIVVLQPMAIDALPADLRGHAHVIHQSVDPELAAAARGTPEESHFQVAFVAHVRPVKDPMCAVHVAAALPSDSRIKIIHVGDTIDASLATEVARAEQGTGVFESLGLLSHEETLRVIGRSRVLLSTSRHEGGANVVSEALALGLPVVATRIPGNVGLLGESYPGTFPVGDAQAAAALLSRCETDPAFLAELQEAARERAWITDPRTEVESWKRLLAETLPSTLGAGEKTRA
jgi:putative glycosyltransferase (TIGR04348 family)